MTGKGKILLCGIDEAGKGPILGPLVLAAVAIEEKNLKKLESLPNLKDSKLLTPKQREILFKEIIKLAKIYKILTINPNEIDEAIDGENELNLNWLEAQKSAQLINELNPDHVFIDCPSPNIPAYTAYLQNIIDTKTEIICKHKAETLFKLVAAASILAKVTRDKEIKEIQKNIKEKIGSGYLTDKITQEFLQNNYQQYPNIIRKSWITYKRLLEKQFQKPLTEFSED